jgi:hypothetical protein
MAKESAFSPKVLHSLTTLFAHVSLIQMAGGLKPAHTIFDLFSLNNSWIKLHSNARRIPYNLFATWKKIDPSFVNTHKSRFQSVYIVALADYVEVGIENKNERYQTFECQLYDHFVTHSYEAVFTIQQVEQIILRAILEPDRPDWYANYFLLISTHLLKRYSQCGSQKAAILRVLKSFSDINHTILAELMLSLDASDGHELLCHFIPSERHIPGFIENMVLSFNAPDVYALFSILLLGLPSGKVINMFMDWMIAIDRTDILEIAAPLYPLCGEDDFLLECGRVLFRLMMLPCSMRTSLPDSLISALVNCFDSCSRRCHPSVIFHPPALPPPPLSVKLDLNNAYSRFPLVSEPELLEGPETVEDVFFMLGSILRQRPQIPANISLSVSEFFDHLKKR